MLRSLREKLKWASLKNGVIRIGLGLTQAVKSLGKCGTSKDKKESDRCLPASKARSLSKSERRSTAAKKKREGAKGKTVVKKHKSRGSPKRQIRRRNLAPKSQEEKPAPEKTGK